MRGGFLHNEVIVRPLADAFEHEDWQTDLEVPIRIGESIAFMDLVAERDGHCIGVEVECSARRVERDLEKAMTLRPDELWIVTPNTRIAGQVRRALARQRIEINRGGLLVLTQGEAVQRVRRGVPLFAGA